MLAAGDPGTGKFSWIYSLTPKPERPTTHFQSFLGGPMDGEHRSEEP